MNRLTASLSRDTQSELERGEQQSSPESNNLTWNSSMVRCQLMGSYYTHIEVVNVSKLCNCGCRHISRESYEEGLFKVVRSEVGGS